jgi:hypothetical protein
MIQLVLASKIVIWDLEQNQMISCLENYTRFLSPKDFVDTGVSIYTTAKKEISPGKTTTVFRELQQNNEQLVYCLPYNDLNRRSGCFF